MTSSLVQSVAALTLAMGLSAAHAQSVTPVGNNGSLTLATSNTDSSIDFNNGLSTPGTYSYGDSFGSASAGTPFYDSFIITVMPGQIDAITTTINVPLGGSNGLGIDGLEARLFSFAPGPGVAIPTTGMPSGGSLIESWTNVVIPAGQATGYVNVLKDPSISQGTYVLQLLGTPESNGGSYGGSVNLSAVPLPSSVLLLATGLLGLAAFTRRRMR
jgi:hypothetical protein